MSPCVGTQQAREAQPAAQSSTLRFNAVKIRILCIVVRNTLSLNSVRASCTRCAPRRSYVLARPHTGAYAGTQR